MSKPLPVPTMANAARKPKSFAGFLLKAILAIFLCAVAGLAGILALLKLEHNSETLLPVPSGHFSVGRVSYAWLNAAQSEDLAPAAETKREVVAWIWYPSANPASAPRAEYLPAAWRVAEAQYSGVLMTQFFTRDLSLVRAHSAANPAVSPERQSYPVVIMRAGSGALTTDYTTLAEDLASHGYIVVGFDAPYRTCVVVLPNNRVIFRPPANDPETLNPERQNRLIEKLLPMWTNDTKFVVSQLERLNAADSSDRFTGRLDLGRLGIFGHSFGGATALQFCHEDARCRAGIDLDGAPYGSVVREGVAQPFLFLLSDHGAASAAEDRAVMSALGSIYDRLPNGRLFISIRGANHFSFSDQMLLKSHLVIGLLRTFGIGALEAQRGFAINSTYIHTFFDVYLKGEPTTALTALPQKYHEVQLLGPRQME